MTDSGLSRPAHFNAATPSARSGSRPARVLVCSGAYLYALLHPDKEERLLAELLARGFAVRRLALDTHGPHYPAAALRRPPGISTTAVRVLESALFWLPWADIVVVPVHRGSQQIVEWARALGKVTVQHDDHGGTDSAYLGADWVAVKGPWFKEHIHRRHAVASERVISTGCIEYDDIHAAETQGWTRDAFCREYGLDPAKRIAVWLPSGISRQDEWSRARYREICDIIQRSPNHSLIIKGHATDYLRYTQREPDQFGGGHSWETLFPGAPVCRPEHTTVCFRVCDVGLTISSSVGLEFPLFGKPFVYVEAFNTPRVTILAGRAPTSVRPIQEWAHWPVPWTPGFIGLSLTTQELPKALAELQYDVAAPERFADHVARFFVANDGKAHLRLADVISQAAESAPERSRWRPAVFPRWLALIVRHWRPWAKGMLRR